MVNKSSCEAQSVSGVRKGVLEANLQRRCDMSNIASLTNLLLHPKRVLEAQSVCLGF